jgi:hypothetical protein
MHCGKLPGVYAAEKSDKGHLLAYLISDDIIAYDYRKHDGACFPGLFIHLSILI